MRTKQAILISVHKNPEQVNHLIDFFPQHEVNIYIHIDAKNPNLISQIKSAKNIYKFIAYRIHWASFNITRASLFLVEKALENSENTYFHLISGEDYPCVDDYDEFYKKCDPEKNYMDHFPLPYRGWAGNGGFDRVNTFHLYDLLDARIKADYQLIRRFDQCKEQNKLLLRRENFYEQFEMDLFGGSAWWSLTRDALTYVTKFTNGNPAFLDRFRNTYVSDELYFQTVLLNSSFSDKIVNDNLRYIDWNERPGNSIPCYLDESDFDLINSSNKLFARKLHLTTIKKFESYLQTRSGSTPSRKSND